jgi:hypothetical protein
MTFGKDIKCAVTGVPLAGRDRCTLTINGLSYKQVYYKELCNEQAQKVVDFIEAAEKARADREAVERAALEGIAPPAEPMTIGEAAGLE